MTSDNRRKRIENFYRISALNDHPVLIECTDTRQHCMKDATFTKPKRLDSKNSKANFFLFQLLSASSFTSELLIVLYS